MAEQDQALETATSIVNGSNSPTPIIKAFFDNDTSTVSYVVHDGESAAIIDSVFNFDQASGRTSTVCADKIVDYCEASALKVRWHLETHAHADHLSAAPYLQGKLGGKLAIGRHIIAVQEVFGKIFNSGTEYERSDEDFDRLFDDGDTFKIGALQASVLHVPGHTPADLIYVIGNAAFVGDTIFMPDFGTARADFPGGDASQLFRSIRRLLSLPAKTRLFLCHDYKALGRDEYRWETTVAEQRVENVHVRDGITEEEFVATRTARDKTLPVPRLLLPSIQVNMRGGRLPEPDANGTRYLKVPLDGF